MIEIIDFTEPVGSFVAETFGRSDKPHAFFLDGPKAGFLGVVDKLTAAQASQAVPAGGESIVAHCHHVLHHLDLFHAYENGERPKPNWPGTWEVQQAKDAEWDALRQRLETGYANIMADLAQREEWPKQAVGAWLIMLAHTAYHLGVIEKMGTMVAQLE